MAGTRIGLKETLLAFIVDGINLLIWQNTKNGEKGINKPAYLTARLMFGMQVEENREFRTVETPEEFHEEFRKIQKGG